MPAMVLCLAKDQTSSHLYYREIESRGRSALFYCYPHLSRCALSCNMVILGKMLVKEQGCLTV